MQKEILGAWTVEGFSQGFQEATLSTRAIDRLLSSGNVRYHTLVNAGWYSTISQSERVSLGLVDSNGNMVASAACPQSVLDRVMELAGVVDNNSSSLSVLLFRNGRANKSLVSSTVLQSGEDTTIPVDGNWHTLVSVNKTTKAGTIRLTGTTLFKYLPQPPPSLICHSRLVAFSNGQIQASILSRRLINGDIAYVPSRNEFLVDVPAGTSNFQLEANCSSLASIPAGPTVTIMKHSTQLITDIFEQ